VATVLSTEHYQAADGRCWARLVCSNGNDWGKFVACDGEGSGVLSGWTSLCQSQPASGYSSDLGTSPPPANTPATTTTTPSTSTTPAPTTSPTGAASLPPWALPATAVLAFVLMTRRRR
jgi:hypothetical protein